MKKLYLASASPRRRELLDMLGFSYELLLPNANEESDERDPARLVALLAKRKAEAALELLDRDARENAVIIGADTVVHSAGKILGKPKNKADAKAMLASLSDTTHEVYSGIAVVTEEKTVAESECTTVHFGHMSEAEIDAYVATGSLWIRRALMPFRASAPFGSTVSRAVTITLSACL